MGGAIDARHRAPVLGRADEGARSPGLRRTAAHRPARRSSAASRPTTCSFDAGPSTTTTSPISPARSSTRSRATTSTRTEDVARALRVVATAGHVDHGKSSLIVALTGIDPDRFVEEKRRGLTIDLGYAWSTLPSGRDVGFVDVPGHERFIANMLAGVGPVRLVLFVVAADEGWKPQSEEHLQILDVLGSTGAVVALTKFDLVDPELAALAEDDVLEHVAGTALGCAPIVPVSARTGEGVEELRRRSTRCWAPPAPRGRPHPAVHRPHLLDQGGRYRRHGHADRGLPEVGDDVELLPGGRRARIRSLQTHKHAEDARRAPSPGLRRTSSGANARSWDAATCWADLVTGDRPTRSRACCGRSAALRARSPHEGPSSSTRAPRRETRSPPARRGVARPGGRAFARLGSSRPLVLDVFDRFVLRETGRRETVAGGAVLDVAPPARPGANAALRLAARAAASRDELPDSSPPSEAPCAWHEAAQLTGVEVADRSLRGMADRRRRCANAAVHALVTEPSTRSTGRPAGGGAWLRRPRGAVCACARAGAGARATRT